MKAFAVLFFAVAVAAEDGLCPKDDTNSEIGHLIAHNDCDKFFKCVQGEAVEMFCPDGLFFNSVFRFCDWSTNVNCGERRVPARRVTDVETTETTERTVKPDVETEEEEEESNEVEFLENGCPVDPIVHWLVPHNEDCSAFFYCVWGEKVERACPNSLHFNRNLQVCDWPQFANCTVKETSTETTTTPSPAESE